MFDLHGALLKKQERECAALDTFCFRHRARSMRLLAQWVRTRVADPDTLDPQTLAGEVVVATDAALLDRLYRHLAGTGVTRGQFDHRYERVKAEAYRQLVAELGDPTPHPLA